MKNADSNIWPLIMYCKLFASLYQGTLRGRSNEILVFTNLLAHCDREGHVDKHFRAIAEEVGISIDDVRAAIQVLESPDPESRSPENDGSRLVRMDGHRAWGWRIVNYTKYRAIKDEDDRREQNRRAQAEWRAKQADLKNPKPVSSVSNSKQPSSDVITDKQRKPKSAHADADADALFHIAPTHTAKPVWSEQKGWENVENLRSDFGRAFPGCNFELQLSKADAWLKANPTKSHRSNWRRFITGWFSRCQDRGGDGKGATTNAAPKAEKRLLDPNMFAEWASQFATPPQLSTASERVIERFLRETGKGAA